MQENTPKPSSFLFIEKWSGCGLSHRTMLASDAIAETPTKSEWSRTVEAMRRAVKTGMGCLGVFGKSGSGKTQAGSAMLRDACGRGETAMYTTAFDLLIDLRDAAKSRKASEREVIEKYLFPHVLMVDDVGLMDEDRWETRMFWHILNKRMDTDGVTILTTAERDEAFGSEVAKNCGNSMSVKSRRFYLAAESWMTGKGGGR